MRPMFDSSIGTCHTTVNPKYKIHKGWQAWWLETPDDRFPIEFPTYREAMRYYLDGKQMQLPLEYPCAS